MGFIEERRRMVLNGEVKVKGRKRGIHVHRREGGTVIDLVLEDSEVRKKIEELRIGDRVESDHQPVEVRIKG